MDVCHFAALFLENPMDGGAWWALVQGFAKSWTRLSDFTSLHFFVFSLKMFCFLTYAFTLLGEWKLLCAFSKTPGNVLEDVVGLFCSYPRTLRIHMVTLPAEFEPSSLSHANTTDSSHFILTSLMCE